MISRRKGFLSLASGQRGLTAFDIMVAVVVTSLLLIAAVKPLRGWIERIRAKNATSGMKHYFILARSRAIANPSRHCGVAFLFHPNDPTRDDSVVAFYDIVSDNVYDPTQDTPYTQPFILKKQDSLSAKVQAAYPNAIVFRGDGSANSSLKIDVKLKHIQSTLDVLASTGRVKVEFK